MPSLFASHCSHHSGILGIVAGRNSHPIWDPSFAPSHFCPPSLKPLCLLIVQHPHDTSSSTLCSLFASHHQHCLGIVGIVAGANLCLIWDAASSHCCLHSLESICLPIIQHPCDTLPSTTFPTSNFNMIFTYNYVQ